MRFVYVRHDLGFDRLVKESLIRRLNAEVYVPITLQEAPQEGLLFYFRMTSSSNVFTRVEVEEIALDDKGVFWF